MVTLILTLSMCALLFLMIWAATYFYPWTGLLRFFPRDIEEKARLHQPPFPAAPVIGWILRAKGVEHLSPVSAPFRRFLPFFLCWASAQLHQKEQKSLEKCQLTGALQF